MHPVSASRAERRFVSRIAVDRRSQSGGLSPLRGHGGAPFGPDDGTVAPWVVVASLPFAPEIVIPTARSLVGVKLGGKHRPYGFKASFNQTFQLEDSATGWWVTPYQFGIDQGPVVMMIENYRSGLIWDLMRRCPPVVTGLRRAGFTGGWL